jgi:hypothetical protein
LWPVSFIATLRGTPARSRLRTADRRMSCGMRPGYQKRPSTSLVPEAIADALGDAAAQYGNVPTEFPEGFD